LSQSSAEDALSEYASGEEALSSEGLQAVTKLTELSTVRVDFVREVGNDLVIDLQLDGTATLVGCYDLEVKTGTVLVNGALLRPESSLHRVYAPSSHALPCIMAKSGLATIVAYSVQSHLRSLSTLSPLWTKLWNEDRGKRSFQLVSSVLHKYHLKTNGSKLGTSRDDLAGRSLLPLHIEEETQKVLNKIMSMH